MADPRHRAMMAPDRGHRQNGMTALLREPLVHFLVLGFAVFGLFAAFGEPTPPPSPDRLEITEDDAARLVGQFQATWRRPPTPDELSGLIERLIDEEVYVREARALGLDRGDAIVRQRLAQKMVFLTESGAEAAIPDDARLQAHLDAYPERFTRAAVVAFEQVPLSGASEETQAVLAALRTGTSPSELGAPSLLPPALPPSPRTVIDGTFGTGFFAAVAGLEPGVWAGPLESAYGSHAVRVTLSRPARVPDLAEIRDAVERDWREEVRADLAAARLEALKSRYEITRPDPEAVLAQ